MPPEAERSHLHPQHQFPSQLGNRNSSHLSPRWVQDSEVREHCTSTYELSKILPALRNPWIEEAAHMKLAQEGLRLPGWKPYFDRILEPFTENFRLQVYIYTIQACFPLAVCPPPLSPPTKCQSMTTIVVAYSAAILILARIVVSAVCFKVSINVAEHLKFAWNWSAESVITSTRAPFQPYLPGWGVLGELADHPPHPHDQLKYGPIR